MENVSSASKTPNSSSNRKSVFLKEWWLIKPDKKESKLGVGGYTNKETRGMRLLGSASSCKRNKNENEFQLVFESAPIARRLDNNTLEAVDGIIITIGDSLHKD
ncbi:kinetochore-associated protein KNL-2 homolog [Rutidosis leptorrhynchoides]|uniref:kinetochore-associated protein KNL-2 homolog n=1 Tax=Rutidosis leptorrhynchoides TaxID=125765 RepID=UPI003A98F420